MKEVAVSIHASENFNLNIIKGLKDLDYIHLDVMDGKFVASQNLNLKVLKIIKENFNIPILAHLMVLNPIDYFDDIIEFAHGIFFHYEIDKNKMQFIYKVKEYGKKVGLALNPETKPSKISGFLSLLDLVLILGVKPGYSGQKFLPNTIDKVNQLAELKKEFSFKIDVDGGVNLENALKLSSADILTSASTILNAQNPNKVIQKLKHII